MGVSIIKGFTASDLFNGASVTTNYLAGYNSTIVKWTTDTAKTIKTGEIWFNGTIKFVDLIPIAGLLEFDCIEVIKSLFGNFNDFIDYQISDLVKYDGNLFKLVDVRFKVNYTDTTDDYIDVTAKFLRSVRQHTDRSNGMYYFTSAGSTNGQTNFLQTCQKSKSYYNQSLKIFKGYPQDISLLAPTANNLLSFAIHTKTGTYVGTVDENITVVSGARTNKEVQRIVLSDGQDLRSVFNTYSALAEGKMQIMHRPDNVSFPTDIYSFNYEIVDECGYYLKWINPCGGFSYWLFNKSSRNIISTKNKGTVSVNAGQLGYNADELNIGVDASEKLQLTAQNIEPEFINHLLEIANSPCVYLYMKPKGSLAYANGNSDVWLKIPQVIDFKYTKKSETNRYQIGFELDLPKIYTQTL